MRIGASFSHAKKEKKMCMCMAQRNRRKFIEARSINYQRRTFRDRNQEPRSISFRNFSTIRETRIVEKGGESTIKERHASSLPFSPTERQVRLLGDAEGRRDRSSCRGVCPEGKRREGGGGAWKTTEAQEWWYATLDSGTGATLLGERYEPR